MRGSARTGSARSPKPGFFRSLFSSLFNAIFNSIENRITILSAVSGAIVLLLATSYLYLSLGESLREQEQEFLDRNIVVLQTLLTQHPEHLEEEVVWEPQVAGSQRYRYYVRVVDDAGDVYLQTPRMDDVMPRELFPLPPPLNAPLEPCTRRASPNGGEFLLQSAFAMSGVVQGKPWILQIALDPAEQDALLRDHRRQMIFTVLLGILLTGGLTAIVVRTGMRPVKRITQAIRRVRAERLHERMGEQRWPVELSELANMFDEMLGRLEESFARLGRFSADIAHELRTPLNNMMGEAELALSSPRSTEEYQQVLESNLEESGRLARIVERLLFLAKGESEGLHTQKEMLRAEEEIAGIRDYFDVLAEEKGISIVTEGEAAVYADSMLLRRALTNLVANAIAYTPSGGKIKLSVGADETGSCNIVVSDTGCGIGEEHLPKVCEAFYRVDESRASTPEGTGLGLAIVASIMDLHSGSLDIESKVGRGTVVTLRFPPEGTETRT